ncbi:MAG: tRNA (cytidine(34)-2'-O)-methyltransferase [Alphaproteobacteria bacterium]|nr:tRNA (cytidine(34)-2'-O)-methyltransferase [Alphaproteobacteria bacterium]
MTEGPLETPLSDSPSPVPGAEVGLALFQPDIAQNAGNMIRTAAALGVAVDLIGPMGFVWGDKKLKRAGMDYLDRAAVTRHLSWEAFLQAAAGRRLVLLTTQGETPYADFRFRAGDILLTGSESQGAPDEVHRAAFARVRIPMRAGLRSLNVAAAAAMVLGEALRQTGGFPK